MKYKKTDEKIAQQLATLLHAYPLMPLIVQKIIKAQGTAYLVGGAVRDMLLRLPIKDLDVEVHGLTLDQLQKILALFGPVNLVGVSFGVLRLPGLAVDWSIPRTDEPGRKPKVSLDPFLDFSEACKRRDLTMNAMGIDLTKKILVDPFGGYADIQKKILRTPDVHRFVEDPLRFYRVMQFIGRFEMYPDDMLNKLCADMDISTVSRERIEEEFKKLFLQSKRPSLGLRWLVDINRLSEVLPEVAALKGIKQNPEWHPEGDVFEHTMQTVDAAAAQKYTDMHEKLILVYAALCHDLGKATTTTVEDGEIKSIDHEEESVKFAKRMLKRITRNNDLIATVLKLVRYHMLPLQFVQQKATLAAYKRLARKLAPETNLRMLAQLAWADKCGRNAKSHKPLARPKNSLDRFIKKAQEAAVLTQVEEPIIHGRDLFDLIEPGPVMGTLVKQLYEIQINEGIRDKKELKKRAKEIIKQNKKS